MYLQPTPSYYSGSGQCAPRAPFLLLLQLPEPLFNAPIYACVRRVALRQLGHWMMGRANIGGKWVSVSGCYGHDGLPLTVDALPRDAVLLPDSLREAWNTGGGWNSGGSEVPAMRAWARENLCK